MPDLANKHTECQVKVEFQLENKYFSVEVYPIQYMRQYIKTLFVVYPVFNLASPLWLDTFLMFNVSGNSPVERSSLNTKERRETVHESGVEHLRNVKEWDPEPRQRGSPRQEKERGMRGFRQWFISTVGRRGGFLLDTSDVSL